MSLWGKKDEELPEVLRGKTPEQIAAALAAAEESVRELPTLRERLTQRESEFGQLQQTVTDAQNRLQQLEARTRPTEPVRQDQRPDWGEDADAAFQDRMSRSGVVQASFHNTATLNRIEGERRLNADPLKAAVLKKYRAEVDEFYNRCTMNDKVQPQCFENVFRLVSGNHLSEIAEASKDPGFLSPDGIPPLGLTHESPKKDLDEVQKLVAERFGISQEDYQKQVANMRFRPGISKSKSFGL